MRSTLISLMVCLFGMVLLIGCATPEDEPIDQLIDIGTHKLYLTCQGSGRPVVVIDTAFGDTYLNWSSIIREISQSTRVCTYDRAGYGQSEPGPLPRNSQREAEELHTLLQNAGIRSPFLLVGHSLGGLNLQIFTANYPDQVAGLVLVDPPPLGWFSEGAFPQLTQLLEHETASLWQAVEAARTADDPEQVSQADYIEALASEQEQMLMSSGPQAAAIDTFEALPLVVIAATEPNPQFGDQAAAFQEFWIKQNEALLSKSSNSKFVLAEGSSHMINRDAPELIIDAIQGLREDLKR